MNKKGIIVKVLALLIANLFLSASLNSSANPVIDQLKMDSAQTHDTHSYSYYRNQSSETRLLTADRTIEFTVYDDQTKEPASLVNLSVTWTSQASFFGADVGKGALYGAVAGAVIVGLLIACCVILPFSASIVSIAVTRIVGGVVAGAIIGGISGALIASQQHNIDQTDYVQTDEDGKVSITRNWQDDVYIDIQLNEETAISKYSDFKPQGHPKWTPNNDDENQKSKNFMYCDIYLVKFDTEGGYLSNLRIAQNKVQNLTYVATVDEGGYTEDSYFKPINMHIQANAEQYAEECNHPEWSSTNFWKGRTSVYPDGKGSDILWVETKRLIYIKDLSGIGEFSLNATYKDGMGDIINQGAPAGAFLLEDEDNGIGLEEGQYWYYQWVWCVGLADLETPQITVEVFINIDGDIPVDPNAGVETIDIPTPQHIITFTFSDSSLVKNVHHTVYAERSIPTVHGDLRYNLYPDGDEVTVRALGIQSLPSAWNTGAYGVQDLFYPDCSYNYYFAVEDEDGNEVFKSDVETLDFNNATMTAFSSEISVLNITPEASYRLTLNNEYFGATMSSTLFFQLTDWDTHQNLSEVVEALIDETFEVTGAGEYGNFDNYHVNQLRLRVGEMNAKIAIQKQRLSDFIDDNGGSNYTAKCQQMIDYFDFFYTLFGKYSSMSPSELASTPSDFTQFRGLCNALLMSYNHAYLYYSASIAYANGDMELVDELVSMMAFEDQLLKNYYDALKQPDTWDLTLIVMIVIALVIASITTVAVGRWYDKNYQGWRTEDGKKKMYIMLGGLFAGIFFLSFFIMYLFFWQPMDDIFGHVRTWGR